jgi:hypothetical protein
MSVLIPTESEEQIAFIQWFRRKYRPVRIFHIANGGFRSKRTAAKLKSEGVMRGVPDLFVPEWNLWIEMKRIKGGRLSPEQRDWKRYLEEIGNTVFVAFGCEHAMELVDNFVVDRENR